MAKSLASARQRVSETPTPRRQRNARGNLYKWGAALAAVVVICVVVTVSSGAATKNGTFVAASPTVVKELTNIPLAEFNKIAVNPAPTAVSGPTKLVDQPTLTKTTASGALPEVFYLGAEYCPFCAAQRWGTIIALSRFGTWSGLGNTSSYSGDEYPNTASFTFIRAKYTSKYVAFSSVEEYANYIDPSTNYYALIQNPTAADDALWKKYDSRAYLPYLTTADAGAIPFVYYGGKYESSGSSFTPQLLAGLSRSDIAKNLSKTTNPVTKAIISAANYQSAAICAMTDGKPGSVCNSSGVRAAAKALGKK